MLLDDALQVLGALETDGVRHWVAGGWGVDALVGEQTREHRDLDLAVDADDLDRCLATLGRLGYASETDWLPVRVELRAPGERWVDVHPVSFDDTGHGVQDGLDGGRFDYPTTAFTVGFLGSRDIACLSERQQEAFHSGYPPRPQDRHDLAQLAALQGEGRRPCSPGRGP